MCGRYSFAPDLKVVNEHYDITASPEDAAPNYNCAPTQMLPVISNDQPHKLSRYRWGLIPFWAKDASIGNRLINARGETIASKPAFKNAFKRRRCLVPADAFYEWLKPDKGKLKIPFRIVLKNQPVFSMAGIWEEWKDPAGEPVRSFSIITTTPNALMAEIHDRMPVILPKEKEEAWLNATDEADLQKMLEPFPAAQMEACRISEKVNSPRNNSPDIIIPAGA